MTVLVEGLSIESAVTVAAGWNLLRRYRLRQTAAAGPAGIYHREVVHRPDTAGVLLYSKTQNSVFLVAQMRLAMLLAGVREPCLEIACGAVEEEERPVDAAVRELREETGFQIETMTPVGTYFLNPSLTTERTHLFLADLDLSPRPQVPIEDNDALGGLRLVEMPLARAWEKCLSGEIPDAKTVLAISRFATGLNQSMGGADS
jgi:nudix-type nucleoside diphosphatase (YffH/AdpP family)